MAGDDIDDGGIVEGDNDMDIGCSRAAAQTVQLPAQVSASAVHGGNYRGLQWVTP